MNEAPRASKPNRWSCGKSCLVLFCGAVLLGGAAAAAAMLFFAALTGGGPTHAPQGFLHVQLSGPLPDGPPQNAFVLDPDALPPRPSAMAAAIREAATDERIDGLLLEVAQPEIGYGIARELREALLVFRSSGKPLVAYCEFLTTRDYYLASACQRIVLAPSGNAFVSGIASENLYYKEAFDRFGIEPQFEHVGDFKSAVEPYTRSGPSPEAQAAMDALFDSWWLRLTTEMAQGRGLERERLLALIDRSPTSPQQALEDGLIDAVAFRSAVLANLQRAGEADWPALVRDWLEPGEEQAEHTNLDDYVRSLEKSWSSKRIALVFAEGTIVPGTPQPAFFGGRLLGDGAFEQWMREIREDDSIHAVVVRVNSPGGSALASDNMWRQLEELQALGKPVVVSMADYAASGGYFIACGADWIMAEPTTITGSIGVFGGMLGMKEALGKLGVRTHVTQRGAQAGFLQTFEPASPEARALFRASLQDFYELFLERVASGRGLSTQAVNEVAQGRVWTGDQALERGLVDELGGLDLALAKAASLAGLSEYGIETWPPTKGLVELLLEDLQDGSMAEVRLPFPGAETALAEFERLELILGQGGIAAYAPQLPRQSR